MIERIVVNVAGDVLFFDAADAMLETGRSRNGPWPRERCGIAAIRMKIFGVGFEMHRNLGKFGEIRNFPGLGAVGEIAVRENDDGNHVFDGDTAGFECDPEAIARRGRRDYGNRSFRISAEERLQKIGLLGFCGEASGRAATLDVANHERKFDGDGEAESFGLESHAGAGSGSDAECTGISRTDG